MRILSALVLVFLSLYAGMGYLRQPVHYQVWGYYPYWMKDEWRKVDLGLYDRVFFFDVPIGEPTMQTGGWPQDWQKLIAAAKVTHLQPAFTLFDAAEFERIFADPARRARLWVDMLALSDRADGMQLDVEIFGSVSEKAVQGYRSFVKAISQAPGRQGKSLSLFVLTEDSAGLYDSETLKAADYVVIQGYDAHWKGSRQSGPVALLQGASPDSWISSLKRYLSLGVPRNKIIMSVPYFGYEWPTLSDAPGALTRGAGREISYAPLPTGLVPEVVASAQARIKQYGLRRDPQSGSPYYAYRDETGWQQGWFEDETSLSAKFAFVKAEHLAGVAVFSLGYDGGYFQDPLRLSFRQ